ncbi:MAG: hypothetical protein ACRD26_03610 [Vicinamibacterales bacterium]
MKVTTVACLFVSKDGRLSIHLMEPPVPSECRVPAVHPGTALHDTGGLSLVPAMRAFKRTVDGALPVYEEV